MDNRNKITVVGAGYVGMSLSTLLAQSSKVCIYDTNKEKVESINSGKSTIRDTNIDGLLKEQTISLTATSEKEQAFKDADFVIIATPTNFNETTNAFDTNEVESVVDDVLAINTHCLIVIKSTIPVGYTDFLRNKYSSGQIIFSPEFLREDHALMDNLYPSRIIIGGQCEQSRSFARLLVQASKLDDIEPIFIESSEAEAIKLFSNTFLAMRVAFFNEMDTYAMVNNLNIRDIIEGVCLDPRIGEGYNNPSFGYGGYCLPKDTKQLLANYNNLPQTLIKAVITSNTSRKDFIAEQIAMQQLNTIGFHRLTMKLNSDNYRTSSIIGIIERLKDKGMKILVFEPLLQEHKFLNDAEIITDLKEFKQRSDLIVTNRKSKDLDDVESKLFTRDIFDEH